MTLRIAQLAPVGRPVSAESTGSIEQIVSMLSEELVARGHSVTLFATGDSETSAELAALYSRGWAADPALWGWEFHELCHTASALERAGDFDVVHSHAYHFALPFTRFVSTPIVHTYHVLIDDDVVRAYDRYPEAHLVSISEFQRRVLNGRADIPVIRHGVDTERFPFGSRTGDYLLFLGKLGWAKGPVEAIHVAREAGMPLVVAGAGDDDYFRHAVAPLLDAPGVEYVGWVGRERRNELLAGAAGLLYTINAAETFGLVMVEAMACGTPVLALDRGAVREIVTNGVTGYHAPDLDALVECVPKAVALDRARIREHTVARFDRRRMVDEYEALYRHVAANGSAPEAR
jgi:glycosyltransferase involved in cell wall biosynthesis